eukprot:1161981-Pelagomonas_calceolata.AAC.18
MAMFIVGVVLQNVVEEQNVSGPMQLPRVQNRQAQLLGQCWKSSVYNRPGLEPRNTETGECAQSAVTPYLGIRTVSQCHPWDKYHLSALLLTWIQQDSGKSTCLSCLSIFELFLACATLREDIAPCVVQAAVLPECATKPKLPSSTIKCALFFCLLRYRMATLKVLGGSTSLPWLLHCGTSSTFGQCFNLGISMHIPMVVIRAVSFYPLITSIVQVQASLPLCIVSASLFLVGHCAFAPVGSQGHPNALCRTL